MRLINMPSLSGAQHPSGRKIVVVRTPGEITKWRRGDAIECVIDDHSEVLVHQQPPEVVGGGKGAKLMAGGCQIRKNGTRLERAENEQQDVPRQQREQRARAARLHVRGTQHGGRIPPTDRPTEDFKSCRKLKDTWHLDWRPLRSLTLGTLHP